jgi:hypothetical protein
MPYLETGKTKNLQTQLFWVIFVSFLMNVFGAAPSTRALSTHLDQT